MNDEDFIALRHRDDELQPIENTMQQLAANVFKGICYFGIIVTALIGNCLVLIAVVKFNRIRQVKTNIFLVSLACADFLVALLVMPFSAVMGLLHGKWIFGPVFCDVFNANDVLFSTASILHLCCISTERYIAVLSPLTYERKMTRSRIALMLSLTWLLSILISYVPILTGIYTTNEHKNQSDGHTEMCEFVVNPYYALISSTTSFWIPSVLMIAVYVRIFMEAKNQEQKIHNLHLPRKRHDTVQNQNRVTEDSQFESINIATETSPQNPNYGKEDGGNNQNGASNLLNSLTSKVGSTLFGTQDHMKIRRENKAAKTLGIIMGAFLLCWLPFFLWYTITNMCGGSQHCTYPATLGEVLFWIGYFNSTLNPMIYAFYNRTFRNAFKQILMCKRRWKSRSIGMDTNKGNARRTNQPLINANGNDNSPHSSRP